MSKTLFLSGVSGFVGSNVAKHVLETTNWHIIAPVSMNHHGNQGRLKTLLDLDPSYLDRVSVVRCDLAMPFEPDLFSYTPDYIWHFAAESHVERSLTDPVPFVKNNYDSTLHVLEYARKVDPDLFFYFSTDEVYGNTRGPWEKHIEWAPIRPSNPYSASKAASEALCYAWWRAYNLPVVITNGMNIIGGSPKGLDQHEEKFLPKVAQALRNGDTIQVHATPSGESGGRFWVNVRDIATAYLYITQELDGDPTVRYTPHSPWVPHRFNIVGEYRSNLDIALDLAETCNSEADIKMVDAHSDRPGHDAFYGLDGYKTKNLGWEPTISLDQTLREVAGMYGLLS